MYITEIYNNQKKHSWMPKKYKDQKLLRYFKKLKKYGRLN